MEIKDMRENLSPEEIKDLLLQYNIDPVHENQLYIQYPTCCHNEHGGSHKLYYYKNTNMFVCYTECNAAFDIFELIQKMENLRGRDCNLPKALSIAGFDPNNNVEIPADKEDDLKSLSYYAKTNQIIPPKIDYQHLPTEIMNNFSTDTKYLEPWLNEGITPEVLRTFNIRYDISNLSIIIPHKDAGGNIIGIRGRFMSEYATAKYMPISWNGAILAHALRGNLYGLYENKEAILSHKTVILFESEKSVMKFSSFFGHSANFSVATCGNKVTNEQIQILRDLGIKQVILAFDKDYNNFADQIKVQNHYAEIASKLSVYFNTSYLFDYGSVLGYKDAPIDKGKDAFLELFNYRIHI